MKMQNEWGKLKYNLTPEPWLTGKNYNHASIQLLMNNLPLSLSTLERQLDSIILGFMNTSLRLQDRQCLITQKGANWGKV